LAQNITNGLLLHYSFNTGLPTDVSGNGRHGQLTGNPGKTQGGVFLNCQDKDMGCGRFGGDYVTAPSFAGIWQSGITITALVRFSASNRRYERIFDFQIPNANPEGISVFLGRRDQTEDLRFANWLDINNKYDLIIPNGAKTDAIHHYAGVIEANGSLTVYLDGRRVASRVGAAPLKNGPLGTNYFGRSNYTCNDYDLRGFLGHVRVYNRALSDADVRLIFETDKPAADLLTVRVDQRAVAGNCNDMTLAGLSNLNGVQYQWLRDEQPIPGATDSLYKPTVGGNYQLRIVDNCLGLNAISPKTLVAFNQVKAPDFQPLTPICSGAALPAFVVSGTRVKWYADSLLRNLAGTGNTFSPATAPSNLSTRLTYYATQTDGQGCVSKPTAVSLAIVPGPVVRLTNRALNYCPTEPPISINAPGGSRYEYEWTEQIVGVVGNTSLLSVGRPGRYRLKVTDLSTGCATVDSLLVTEQCGQAGWYIPDMFTPNGDGDNELLDIKGEPDTPFELSVYDRWGKIVYYLNAPDLASARNAFWDGRIDGRLPSTGVFTYKLIINKGVLVKTGRVLSVI
jgi:gliding motility-associated-like protein